MASKAKQPLDLIMTKNYLRYANAHMLWRASKHLLIVFGKRYTRTGLEPSGARGGDAPKTKISPPNCAAHIGVARRGLRGLALSN